MEKEKLIEKIGAFVRTHLVRNRRALGYGRCYDVFGSVQRNGNSYGIISGYFSELPETRGKLSFDLMGRGCDDISLYADELSVEELESIISQTPAIGGQA